MALVLMVVIAVFLLTNGWNALQAGEVVGELVRGVQTGARVGAETLPAVGLCDTVQPDGSVALCARALAGTEVASARPVPLTVCRNGPTAPVFRSSPAIPAWAATIQKPTWHTCRAIAG